ncbi:MAG TPA: MaoC family dehydratase [Candidatus Binataceae bacterium]|nr:MaoC family dehydratase [Candidatus Binataceae bacterium]
MSFAIESLTGKENHFEDFAVGDVYEHARGKTVEALENVLITNLVLNTAQLHFNEHMAESVPQGHRVTFGGVTASLVIGLAMQDTGENAVEEISLDKVRFRVPVLHGDTLYAFTEVLEKDENPADLRGYKDVGLVRFRHWGVNQRGETVFEGERSALVKKRAFSLDGLAYRDQTSEARTAALPARRQKIRPKPISASAKPRVAKPSRAKTTAKPSKAKPGGRGRTRRG